MVRRSHVLAIHAANRALTDSNDRKAELVMARIQAISDDAEAKVALTLSEVSERSTDLLDEAPHLKALTWIPTDLIPDDEGKTWKPRKIQPADLAMLQYTSGSTGTPKGVMLTHANIMHNCQIICWGFEPTRDTSGLSWLPTYHDMGLVGGCLKALFYGRPATIMNAEAVTSVNATMM